MGMSVEQAALDRVREVYDLGAEPVVSFSGGKDSTCILEITRQVAKERGRLPLHVVMRDEEICYPGTYELCERIAAHPEIKFTWIVANQPIINAFCREQPYWWVFDAQVPRELWVREPPAWATHISELHIGAVTPTVKRLHFPDGPEAIGITGIRANESSRRMMGVHATKGALTFHKDWGVRRCRPIYDWTDGDVWKFIKDRKLDYNTAYDAFFQLGVPARRLRIGPPTMTVAAISTLRLAAQSWPQWWVRVCKRLPGMREAARFGKRALEPERRSGEAWEATFRRECIEEAPAWIAERATYVMTVLKRVHLRHAGTEELPESSPCSSCHDGIGSWRKMTEVMYSGDPFCLKCNMGGSLPYMEPEFFRAGAGTWSGKPNY